MNLWDQLLFYIYVYSGSITLLISLVTLAWLVKIQNQLNKINIKGKKIMASQQEEAQLLEDIKFQFSKAKDEIVAKIDELTQAVANAGVTSPEVDQATADLKSLAQGLDDIVPDAPQTNP